MHPVDWTPELIAKICDEITSGRSIRELSTENWCPSEPSIYRRMASDNEFAERIAGARVAQQDFIADECVAMADMATEKDWQVVKLRIWARQWRASKLAPKKYGDKVQTEVTGSGGGALNIVIATGVPREATGD